MGLQRERTCWTMACRNTVDRRWHGGAECCSARMRTLEGPCHMPDRVLTAIGGRPALPLSGRLQTAPLDLRSVSKKLGSKLVALSARIEREAPHSCCAIRQTNQVQGMYFHRTQQQDQKDWCFQLKARHTRCRAGLTLRFDMSVQ